jgi:hypothetical protein
MYTVPNVIRLPRYTPEELTVRTDVEETGYDEVTNIKKSENLSVKSQERFLPFLKQITETDYIDNPDVYLLSDLIATQEWGSNLSANIQVFDYFINDKKANWKISEDGFLNDTFRKLYRKKDGSEIVNDDIESFGIETVYCYETNFDKIHVNIKDVVFKEADHILEREGSAGGFYVPEKVYEYYFDIPHVKRELVREMLTQPYLITPAMYLDGKYYREIKGKISYLEYSASMEK